ncbi:hypothetical protein CCP2SC5_70068 [Azospirillaceae bacterium]
MFNLFFEAFRLKKHEADAQSRGNWPVACNDGLVLEFGCLDIWKVSPMDALRNISSSVQEPTVKSGSATGAKNEQFTQMMDSLIGNAAKQAEHAAVRAPLLVSRAAAAVTRVAERHVVEHAPEADRVRDSAARSRATDRANARTNSQRASGRSDAATNRQEAQRAESARQAEERRVSGRSKDDEQRRDSEAVSDDSTSEDATTQQAAVGDAVRQHQRQRPLQPKRPASGGDSSDAAAAVAGPEDERGVDVAASETLGTGGAPLDGVVLSGSEAAPLDDSSTLVDQTPGAASSSTTMAALAALASAQTRQALALAAGNVGGAKVNVSTVSGDGALASGLPGEASASGASGLNSLLNGALSASGELGDAPSSEEPIDDSQPLEQEFAALLKAGQEALQSPSVANEQVDNSVAASATDVARAAEAAAAKATNILSVGGVGAATRPSGGQTDSDVGGDSNNGNAADSSMDRAGDSLTNLAAPEAGARPASGQDFASHLTAFRGARPGQPVTVPEQITVHIQRGVAEGKNSMTLQLRPHELGRIDVRLETGAEGHLRAVITADSAHTLELLQRDQRGLEQALKDAGLKMDNSSLSFNLRSDSNPFQQAEQRGDQMSGRRRASGYGRDEDAVEEAPRVQTLQLAPGRIDVRV